MPFGLISGAIGVATGLKGLFSSKPKPARNPRPDENLLSQAKGAREAAEAYGFNPLTMLQYGQPAGSGPIAATGGTPPLASVQAITDGLRDINDVWSGDAARRRRAEELELDLARIKLDQARSGVITAPVASDGVGASPSVLGRRATPVVQPTGTAPLPRSGGFGSPTPGPNSIAPGRKQEIDPVINSPGVFEIQNKATGGYPISIPGEGEPWGIDELATAVVVGVPQILGRGANELIYDGKSFSERMKEYEDREKKRAKKSPVSKAYDGPGGPVYLPR